MRYFDTRRGNHPSPRAESRDRSYLEQSLPASRRSVPTGRRVITEFAAAAGASEELLGALRLAVSEALANVVLYAYPEQPGQIDLTAGVAGRELWVLIADDGCGIRAGRDSKGLGQGLALISQLSDGFSIVKRSSGGTELQLQFELTEGGRRDDPQSRGSVASARRPAASRFSTTT